MTFAIAIANPGAGWIDVELRLGDTELAFAASAVANDPVRELAELALFLARGQPGAARAVFWLEPAGYELRATRDADSLLALGHWRRAFTRADPQLVTQLAVQPAAIAAEIRRCLRAALPVFAAARAADPRAWYHPFPEDLLVQLASAIPGR